MNVARAASARVIRAMLAAVAPAGRRCPLSIFIFHRVRRLPDPLAPDDVDVRRFDEMLSWIGEWFNVLPLGEAIERLRQGTLPSRSACITFDDGYADNYTEGLPLLVKHGLHATFFIATGFLDGKRMWNDTLLEAIRGASCSTLDLTDLRLGVHPLASTEQKQRALGVIVPTLKYRPMSARADAVSAVAERCAAPLPQNLMLTTAQLRALHDAGMGIGAHTVDHPVLSSCSDSEARTQIADSRAALEDLLGERITLFAYPNGRLGTDYEQKHVDLVRSLKFAAAVSTNPGASRHGEDLFQLRRFTPWDSEKLRFGIRLVRNVLSTPRA